VNGLRGGLDLIATRDSAGRTMLSRQKFSPPIHISKPHHDRGWLVVNLASPSPGLLEGDRVDVRVQVESGARLLLTAPSANRIHATPSGHAELAQRFSVNAGGFLDVWPEYLIPQAGARYRQRTELHVADGGTLLWTETIAPGRTARGEVFAFEELKLSMDLWIGEAQLVRERYRLDPRAVAGLRARFPTAYYASLIAIGEGLVNGDGALRELTAQYPEPSCWLGATRVAAKVWAIKIVAADSPTLRATISAVRATLSRCLGYDPANVRRTTGEVILNPRSASHVP
jgi:urease accessory protein